MFFKYIRNLDNTCDIIKNIKVNAEFVMTYLSLFQLKVLILNKVPTSVCGLFQVTY